MNLDAIISQLIATHQALPDQQRPVFITRLTELLHDKNTSEPSSSTSPSPEIAHPGHLLSDLPSSPPIQWLWPDRLPLGHLTLLEGHSGLGTSLFALTLAAAISNGTPIFHSPSGQQGHVLLVTPGLHHSGLLRQRLEIAGANLTRITLLSTADQPDPQHATDTEIPFELPAHLSILEETITRLSPSLVIVDPLTLAVRSNRFLPDILSRLSALAERATCALLLVHHLPAGRTSALAAYASSILRLSDAPGAPGQRLLTTVKHTLAPASPDLVLQISAPVSGVPTFQFLQEAAPAPASSGDLSLQRQTILRALEASRYPLTPLDLAQQTGLPYEPLRLLLSRMTVAGEIRRTARGYYTSLQAPTSLSQDLLANFYLSGTSDATDTIDVVPPSLIPVAENVSTSPDTTDTIDAANLTNPSDSTAATGPSGAPGSPGTSDTSETCIFVNHFPPVQPGPSQ